MTRWPRRIRASMALTATAMTIGAGAAAATEPPTEFWEVQDYATILEVRGDGLQTYQTTDLSCLKADAGTPAGPDRYNLPDDIYTLTRTTTPDRATLRVDGSPGHRTLRRLTALPPRCTDPGEPSGFDVFWQTFRENYPFFDAKGIDWNRVRDRYRERALTAEHTGNDRELFATLSDMIAPLQDAHVAVIAPGIGRFATARPGTVAPTPEYDATIKSYIRQSDFGGVALTDYGRGRISYADLPGHPDYGYLRLSGFSGFSDSDTFADNSAELDRALNDIFTPDRKARLRGLILDLRVNGGGSDSLGLQLAARLTDAPYFAYAKQTRTTEPQPQQIRPAAPVFAGPVAILTGGSTVSAGETFTQAMIERPAPTIRIGASTQGVFSDVLERKFPGAHHDTWMFGLPNELFRTADGRTFDGPGIPPQIPEPVFTDEEIGSHRDSAFDRAVRWLSDSEPVRPHR
ncbi:S41 family peptidase [Nocardia terpenica]|nr:S41 family peptidase [Nocardia terpenica]NQE91415.1 S41 family peptidase [Nocardia terpenica]